jgi:hypothetical protein
VSAGREHAVDVLRAEAGTQFDPMIVNSFIDALPVRLPVAGALVLLAGPAALGRRLAVWLKRVGAGHLAPAAATLGAIVTLGSFMPNTALPVRPAPVIAQQQSQAPVTRVVRVKPAVIKQVEMPAREPKPALVAAVPTTRKVATVERDIVMGATLTRPDKPEVDHHAAKPKPSAPPTPEPSDEPEPTSEPTPTQVDDGCTGNPESNGHENGKGHEKAKGEGHEKHCD